MESGRSVRFLGAEVGLGFYNFYFSFPMKKIIIKQYFIFYFLISVAVSLALSLLFAAIVSVIEL